MCNAHDDDKDRIKIKIRDDDEDKDSWAQGSARGPCVASAC